MKDNFGRTIKYLRISLTDRCNNYCFYCRDKNSQGKQKKKNEITLDEIKEYVQALASLGVEKVRLTGGEPLLRDDIIDIAQVIKKVEGIKELCLTTNGVFLKDKVQLLKDAGVDRLNISLNTLDKNKYKIITGTDNFDSVLKSIEGAKKAGFENLKLNVVLMKSINDDEIKDFVELTRVENITVRFIEYMPIGAAIKNFDKYYMPSNVVLSTCPNLKKIKDDGVSLLYKCDGYKGSVGLIKPVSDKFCSTCNRIRLTSDCMLRFCLHNSKSVSLKGLHKEELIDTIKKSICLKPYSHQFEKGLFLTKEMNTIGG